MATHKRGLWDNINTRKRAGTSRPKSAGTVSEKSLRETQAKSAKKAKARKKTPSTRTEGLASKH